MDDMKPTAREVHKGWDFLFFISREAEGGMFVGVAEIQKQGQLHCKLVTVRSGPTHKSAVDLLRKQCTAWVVDWDARPHTGDTGAMPLE
jgi:hypothetical protein